jgi:hypothetical protein
MLGRGRGRAIHATSKRSVWGVGGRPQEAEGNDSSPRTDLAPDKHHRSVARLSDLGRTCISIADKRHTVHQLLLLFGLVCRAAVLPPRRTRFAIVRKLLASDGCPNRTQQLVVTRPVTKQRAKVEGRRAKETDLYTHPVSASTNKVCFVRERKWITRTLSPPSAPSLSLEQPPQK